MNKIIGVEDICRARDNRIERLKKISDRNPCGLILFTLNIPGPVKDSFLYRKIFSQGLMAILSAFSNNRIVYTIEHTVDLDTGSEAYFTLSTSDLTEIKTLTVDIEENHQLGRIFDIDVFDSNLNQIKSKREMRKCFICDRPAFECSRSRRHSMDDVLKKIKTTADEYFDLFFWKISSTAIRAMITEVLVTPKPGLVDTTNSGSHFDMDLFTFTDSSTALTRTFYLMAKQGGGYNGKHLWDLLVPLRKIGIEGEQEMYRVTEGVNTQKGLIFSIGILSAAAGYILCQSKNVLSADILCQKGGEIAADISKRDFEEIKFKTSNDQTNGEKLFKKYGIKGARGEAEGGFPSALKALSILKSYLAENVGFEKALAGSLIHIISEIEDTNISGRGSLDTLKYVKKSALSFIKNGDIYRNGATMELEKLDADFIRNNISPGGSADILAVTIFLYFLEKEFGAV